MSLSSIFSSNIISSPTNLQPELFEIFPAFCVIIRYYVACSTVSALSCRSFVFGLLVGPTQPRQFPFTSVIRTAWWAHMILVFGRPLLTSIMVIIWCADRSDIIWNTHVWHLYAWYTLCAAAAADAAACCCCITYVYLPDAEKINIRLIIPSPQEITRQIIFVHGTCS